MQKVVTVRASQKDLQDTLNKFTNSGWRIVSVVKGSEWGRVGFSYKWTVILEQDVEQNANCKDIEKIQRRVSSVSVIKAIIFVLATLAALIILPLCLIAFMI